MVKKGASSDQSAISSTSATARSKTATKAADTTDTEEVDLDDISQIAITLMMLRKPTELKKVIDSVPKPMRAVPKNGLPVWYKLGLENKLPVPKMPAGRIIFSRGKMGEDIRRIGLGAGNPPPSFDLTDPYCYNVSYDYIPLHDPHLANYFRQKLSCERMKSFGFATKDGRAICSLKDFNTYRKYLYNRFMDRIHMEMMKLDERARDDLVLKKVETNVARQAVIFGRAERARELMEKHERIFAEEIAEKKRRAKEQEMKISLRMVYLAEYNEKCRKERMARMIEKETRIKQRVQAAAEMELRRKISMIRQWRINEKKRLARVKADREAKIKAAEEKAEMNWEKRVRSQNRKIEEARVLLQLYSEDMQAASAGRHKRAQIAAYNTDLALQAIRIENMKAMHGANMKRVQLVRKMGCEFEKSKRGAKGMSVEVAQKMAKEAMAQATSTAADPLMVLGAARAMMDLETILPPAPIKLLSQILETAVVEFARRRVHLVLSDVEHEISNRALNVFLETIRPSGAPKPRPKPRYVPRLETPAVKQSEHRGRTSSIVFGEVDYIDPDVDVDYDLKRARDRPPTPVPSLTLLAEATFNDRIEDLPDPTTIGSSLPERNKLLENVKSTAKILTKSVNHLVDNGMDLTLGKVIMPRLRFRLEWGEVVESVSDAVVNNRIKPDCPELRHASLFLAFRILKELQSEMKKEKEIRKKNMTRLVGGSLSRWPTWPITSKDFYVPDKEEEEKDVKASQSQDATIDNVTVPSQPATTS